LFTLSIQVALERIQRRRQIFPRLENGEGRGGIECVAVGIVA
jgi:hypothetical protein